MFWFDPAQIGATNRYQCREGMASIIDKKRCNDPTYEFFNDGCCCNGCTEPVEILMKLSDKDGGIGEAPANESERLCQCGPGLRPLVVANQRKLGEEDRIFQERVVGAKVGSSAQQTPVFTGSSAQQTPVFTYSFILVSFISIVAIL